MLWASLGEGDLYPPGLAGFGLDPAAMILLSAPSPAELLWAMEEALRSPALAGVVGEVDRLDLTAGRRLQLAAAAGGGVGFLLLRADRPPRRSAPRRCAGGSGRAEPKLACRAPAPARRPAGGLDSGERG